MIAICAYTKPTCTLEMSRFGESTVAEYIIAALRALHFRLRVLPKRGAGTVHASITAPVHVGRASYRSWYAHPKVEVFETAARGDTYVGFLRICRGGIGIKPQMVSPDNF